MNLFLLKEWFTYFHLKTDEHSLHSPFFYHFFLDIINKKTASTDFEQIENKRLELKQSNQVIHLNDLGAGSKANRSKRRFVKDIAKNSLSTPKFSQLLYRIIKTYQFTEIVELGTCLGITSGYMALANPKATITTFEGDPNLILTAQKNLLAYPNIQFVLGNIDETLPEFLLLQTKKIDLVYIDANHTYEATVNYFHQLLPYRHTDSIFVLDDIHWSEQMKKAWEEIKNNEAVTGSIDLFDAGFLFFKADFQNQHYILDF